MAMEWRLDATVDYLFGMRGYGLISARCHGGWHEMHGGDARVRVVSRFDQHASRIHIIVV